MSVKISIVHEADARQNRAGSSASDAHQSKKVLVIGIGGTSVKLGSAASTSAGCFRPDARGSVGPEFPHLFRPKQFGKMLTGGNFQIPTRPDPDFVHALFSNAKADFRPARR